MAKIRKMVLDVMKPHDPSVIVYTEKLADIEDIYGVNSSVVEIDEEVENLKITLEGDDMEFSEIERIINELGGSIHSIDRVLSGEKIIEDVVTPQDS